MTETDQQQREQAYWQDREPCVCCGSSVDDARHEDQPACGHLFCELRLGRGHGDECYACTTGGGYRKTDQGTVIRVLGRD